MDFSASKGLVEALQTAVQAHIESKPHDFSAEFSVNVNVGGDPLKASISIWWCYAYNGEKYLHRPVESGLRLHVQSRALVLLIFKQHPNQS